MAMQALTLEQRQALTDRFRVANDDGTLSSGVVGDSGPSNLTNYSQLAKSYTTQYQGLDQQDVQARLQDDPIYNWLHENNWLTAGDGGQPQLGGAYNDAMAAFMKQHPSATFRPSNYDSTDSAKYVGGQSAIDPLLGGYREGGQWQAKKGDWLEQLGNILPYLAAAGMTAGAGAAVGAVSGGAAGFNIFNVPGMVQSLSNLGGSPSAGSTSQSSAQGTALQALLQLLSRYSGKGG